MNNILPIVGFCYNDNPALLRKVCRVLRYTSAIVRGNPPIMQDLKVSHTMPTIFSYLKPPSDLDWGPCLDKLAWVQIPPLERTGFLIFYAKTMPLFLPDDAEHIMHVGEDGFILNPRSWRKDFSVCDFIGAPWENNVVGNDGFSLQSRNWVTSMAHGDFIDGSINPDWLYCRDEDWIRRNNLFVSSAQIASAFSSELLDDVEKPFGFHGLRHGAKYYTEAWKRLEGWEILNDCEESK